MWACIVGTAQPLMHWVLLKCGRGPALVILFRSVFNVFWVCSSTVANGKYCSSTVVCQWEIFWWVHIRVELWRRKDFFAEIFQSSRIIASSSSLLLAQKMVVLRRDPLNFCGILHLDKQSVLLTSTSTRLHGRRLYYNLKSPWVLPLRSKC